MWLERLGAGRVENRVRPMSPRGSTSKEVLALGAMQVQVGP